ncbi:MAG: DNA polymerase III subunit gamma/tau [Nitrospirota bacterium]
MSYLVLARKWRPQGFDDLIGQESIVRLLKNSIEQGKIGHAYVFSGPRGVGKTSTARILAKALNCINGPTPTPCGSCPSCVSITDGFSMDVMEIDGASNTGVDDIRDLRERIKYAPSAGKYKVYIIDEAHMLSGSAFNALLKTLEEPPSYIVFVLATTSPRKIPLTVLSRCQHLTFRRIPSHLIKERLKKISEAEGINISSRAIELVARAADGSLRDSLTILDQISSFSSDITETDVKDLIGITDFDLISRISVAIIEGKRDEILKLIAEMVENGTDIRSFTKELVQFFRDLLVASVISKPEEILDLSKEERDVIKDILLKTSEEQLTLMLSEILKAEIEIRNASSPRLALEMSLIKASFLSNLKPVKEIIENLDTYIKPEAGSEDLISDIPEPITQKEIGAKTLTDETFERVLQKIDLPLASKLSKAKFRLDGNKLFLIFNGGDSFFADSINKHLEVIEQAFSEELGRKIHINVETIKKKLLRKKDLKEEMMSEPAIKEILELFDGRVIDVIPKSEDTGG